MYLYYILYKLYKNLYENSWVTYMAFCYLASWLFMPLGVYIYIYLYSGHFDKWVSYLKIPPLGGVLIVQVFPLYK